VVVWYVQQRKTGCGQRLRQGSHILKLTVDLIAPTKACDVHIRPHWGVIRDLSKNQKLIARSS
jgi:hypothetical protein